MIDKILHKAFIAPEYKSSSDGDDGASVNSSALDTEATGSDLNSSVEDIFGLNSDGTTEEEALNPFGLQVNDTEQLGTTIDPLTGEVVQDPDTTPYYVKSIDEFLNDSRIAGLNMKIEDYDNLLSLYKQSRTDLSAERNLKNQNIEKGIDVKYNQQLVSCIDKSLIKINEAIARIPTIRKEVELAYQKEYEDFKKSAEPHVLEWNKGTASDRSNIIINYLAKSDSNLDGWIGEPEKGFRILDNVVFKDGTKGSALYDASSNTYISKLASNGAPVTKKWFDPAYQWDVTNKSGVEQLIMADDKEGYNGDLLFNVNDPNGNDHDGTDNDLGAKINISIPDYITVRIEDDGEPKVRTDRTDGVYCIPAKYEKDGTTIRQSAVTDYERYAQFKVDKVEVFSADEKNANGSYDQIVRFKKATGEILSEFKIKNGSNYAFLLNGDERSSPVSIDAEGMRSTFQGNFKNESAIKDEYDVHPENLTQTANGTDPVEMFNDTFDMFTEGSGVIAEDDSDIYKATGILVDNVAGCVRGSNFGNNFVRFRDVSELEDIDPKDETGEPNKLWRNVMIGNGGSKWRNAAFVKGDGDFYATDMTLVYRSDQGSDAVTAISMKPDFGVKESATISRTSNDKTQSNKGSHPEDYETQPTTLFAYLGGTKGKKFIDDPLRSTYVDNKDALTDKEEQMVIDKAYYNTLGTGSYALPLTNSDTGLVGNPNADTSKGGSDGAISESKMEEMGDEVEEALMDLYDFPEEDPYPDPDLDSIGGDYYDETAADLKAAFDELAEGLNFTKNSWLDDDEEEGE